MKLVRNPKAAPSDAVITDFSQVHRLAASKLTQVRTSSFVYLQGQHLSLGELLDWETYLNELIKNEHWEKAMAKSISVQKGTMKLLANLSLSTRERNAEMQEFFKKLGLTYCLFIVKLMDSEPGLLDTEFEKVVQFLLYTKCVDYLFTVIRDFMFSQELSQLFMSTLDKYIRHKKISYIPDYAL